MNKEELIPRVCVVKAIRQETSDVKTFMVVDQDGNPGTVRDAFDSGTW